jgi:BirA family biotin operon repressor/biotin-[acetyl-CoA-carboxylase] ligase
MKGGVPLLRPNDLAVLSAYSSSVHRAVEEIAAEVGISTAEVEAALGRLEGAGYRWGRHPARGPFLHDADRLLRPGDVEAALRTEWMGRTLLLYRSLPSTNAFLLSMAAGGEPGTVIAAEEQSGGRGRLGRRWEAPPYRALLFSLLLRPSGGAGEAARATLTAGIAVAEGVAEEGGPPLRIRWPNDLVADEGKVCGILSEYAPEGPSLVVGIGLNVNQERQELPDGAASLRTCAGRDFARASLLAALLGRLEVWWDRLAREGFGVVRERAEELSALVGRTVTIDLGEEKVEGIASGIGPRGGLLIGVGKERREVLAGEVVRVRPLGVE